jgi:hypothetical protein
VFKALLEAKGGSSLEDKAAKAWSYTSTLLYTFMMQYLMKYRSPITIAFLLEGNIRFWCYFKNENIPVQ